MEKTFDCNFLVKLHSIQKKTKVRWKTQIIQHFLIIFMWRDTVPKW